MYRYVRNIQQQVKISNTNATANQLATCHATTNEKRLIDMVINTAAAGRSGCHNGVYTPPNIRMYTYTYACAYVHIIYAFIGD